MDDLPNRPLIAGLEDKHATAIHQALAASVTGVAAAIRQALQNPVSDPNLIQSAVNVAVTQNVGLTMAKPMRALQILYAEAVNAGSHAAATQIGSKALPTQTLADLLAKRNITLKGIEDTVRDRIGTAIRDGMAQGQGYREISQAVQDTVMGPMLLGQASTIAVTEVNYAFTQASLDQYQAAGLQQFEWHAYDGACDDCQDQEGTHDLSDPHPPEHPNCRCVVTGVLD